MLVVTSIVLKIHPLIQVSSLCSHLYLSDFTCLEQTETGDDTFLTLYLGLGGSQRDITFQGRFTHYIALLVHNKDFSIHQILIVGLTLLTALVITRGVAEEHSHEGDHCPYPSFYFVPHNSVVSIFISISQKPLPYFPR